VITRFGQNKFCDAGMFLRMPDVAIAIASDSVDISKYKVLACWVLTIYSFHCALLRLTLAQSP
jgi:hypothetical protein